MPRPWAESTPAAVAVARATEPVQVPLAPAAGFLAAVPAPDAYPVNGAPLSVMRWALSRPGISHAERAVLGALAWHTNDCTITVCYPSLDRICECTGGMLRGSVARALASLETKGLIRRQRQGERQGERGRGGRGHVTTYLLGERNSLTT